MSFCKNCGAKLSGDDVFCPSCGERVTASEAASPENNSADRKEEIDRAAQLLKQMQDGDATAFTKLYELTNSYVQYTVRRQLGPDDDWEDVVQEVYIAVFQQYGSVKNRQAAFAWIKQIAFRKACDYNRKKYRVNEAEDASHDISDAVDLADDSLPVPEDILVNSETQAVVRGAIDELSLVQRNALIGYYYDEMKTREIAESLGIPEGTVLTALHRGRKALKTKMEAYQKKSGVKLLSLGGLGLLFPFVFADAQAQAIELPLVQATIRSLAAKIASGAVSSTISGSSAGAVSGTMTSAAATGTGAAATKVVAILVAATLVVGGGYGGVKAYQHHKAKKPSVEQQKPKPAKKADKKPDKKPDEKPEKKVQELSDQDYEKYFGITKEEAQLALGFAAHWCGICFPETMNNEPGELMDPKALENPDHLNAVFDLFYVFVLNDTSDISTLPIIEANRWLEFFNAPNLFRPNESYGEYVYTDDRIIYNDTPGPGFGYGFAPEVTIQKAELESDQIRLTCSCQCEGAYTGPVTAYFEKRDSGIYGMTKIERGGQ